MPSTASLFFRNPAKSTRLPYVDSLGDKARDTYRVDKHKAYIVSDSSYSNYAYEDSLDESKHELFARAILQLTLCDE